MSARLSPSLPTPKQIRDVHDAVSALHPGARIIRIGPEGLTFEYPDTTKPASVAWEGRAFSDRA